MSAKVTGQVWELDLPANKQLILLALADHADHEGNNVYPSVGLIAWKTGYSERQVQRLLKELVTDTLLVIVEQAVGQTIKYRIDVAAGRKKEPRKVDEHPRQIVRGDTGKGGDNLSPHPRHSYVTPGGDIQMSPDPSVESSIKGEGEDTPPTANKSINKPTKSPGMERSLVVAQVKSHPFWDAFVAGWDGIMPALDHERAQKVMGNIPLLVNMGATDEQITGLTRRKVNDARRKHEYRFEYLVADMPTYRASKRAEQKPTGPKPFTAPPQNTATAFETPEEALKAIQDAAREMRKGRAS